MPAPACRINFQLQPELCKETSTPACFDKAGHIAKEPEEGRSTGSKKLSVLVPGENRHRAITTCSYIPAKIESNCSAWSPHTLVRHSPAPQGLPAPPAPPLPGRLPMPGLPALPSCPDIPFFADFVIISSTVDVCSDASG